MYKLGHYGAALLAYAPIGFVVATEWDAGIAVAGCFLSVALSTVPDFDTRVPLLKHRGPTHSVAFALGLGAGLAAITAILATGGGPVPATGVGVAALVGFAFLVGVVAIGSHLLADVITPMGIRPWWPFSSRHYTFDFVPSADPGANYVLLLLGVVAVALAGVGVSGPF